MGSTPESQNANLVYFLRQLEYICNLEHHWDFLSEMSPNLNRNHTFPKVPLNYIPITFLGLDFWVLYKCTPNTTESSLRIVTVVFIPKFTNQRGRELRPLEWKSMPPSPDLKHLF